MAKEKEKIPKYATVTFKYYENEDKLPNAARLLQYISSSIVDYNTNKAQYGYSKVDIVWFSVEPDEMDIEEQNNTYNKIVNNDKSRK